MKVESKVVEVNFRIKESENSKSGHLHFSDAERSEFEKYPKLNRQQFLRSRIQDDEPCDRAEPQK